MSHFLYPALPIENEDGSKGQYNSSYLQCEYRQRLFRSPRQPLDREKRDDGYLCHHEQLPYVRSGAFIRLRGWTKPDEVEQHGRESGQRHNYRNEGARLLDHSGQAH